MPIRRLVLLALCSTTLACTVSPLPSPSSPTPAGPSELEESLVRAAVNRHLRAGAPDATELEIASVDLTGDVAAVKVVETYPEEVHVGYLNVARSGSEWKVVNEVSTSWPR